MLLREARAFSGFEYGFNLIGVELRKHDFVAVLADLLGCDGGATAELCC